VIAHRRPDTSKPRGSYDWDRPDTWPIALEEVLDIDYRAQWDKPLTQPEASFWRGVLVGCVAEAIAVLVILAIGWVLSS